MGNQQSDRDRPEATSTTYQDIGILAHGAIGMGLDNALDSTSGVQLLSGSHEGEMVRERALVYIPVKIGF